MINLNELLISVGVFVALAVFVAGVAAIVWTGLKLRTEIKKLTLAVTGTGSDMLSIEARIYAKITEIGASVDGWMNWLTSSMAQYEKECANSARDAASVISSSVGQLNTQLEVLAKLPGLLKELGDYTLGHVKVAQKFGTAMVTLTKTVNSFTNQLFSQDRPDTHLELPTEATVGKEFDIQEILRGNTGMSRRAAEALAEAQRGVAIDDDE